MTEPTDPAAALLRDVRPEIEKAIYDPGTTEGYKGDRTLTAWQTDAVMRAVLAALSAHLDPALSEQAAAELQDVMRCRCHEAYKGRGLHDPDCQCDSQDALNTILAQNAALRAERDALVRENSAAYAQGYGDCEAEISLTEIGRTNEFLHGQIAKWKARAEAAEAEVEKLRGALSKLHHAVCGETGFAACVRLDSGKAYPWPALDDADETARAALATEADNG